MDYSGQAKPVDHQQLGMQIPGCFAVWVRPGSQERYGAAFMFLVVAMSSSLAIAAGWHRLTLVQMSSSIQESYKYHHEEIGVGLAETQMSGFPFIIFDRKRNPKVILGLYLHHMNSTKRGELISILQGHKHILAQAGVTTLAVFGSQARGDDRQESDIDLLVAFNRPVGIFEFIRLKLQLEQLTGLPVDLVTEDALRPEMRDQILSEALYVS